MNNRPLHEIRTMSVAAAFMFAAAAALTLVALVLPHAEGPDPLSEVATSGVALLCAAAVLKAGPRMRVWHFHVLLQVGNLLIAVGMYTGGSMDATENYSLLYLWGALYAAYFFSRRVLLYHFAGGALGYGLVLLLKESNSEWVSQWFLTMGSFVVAGIVVNWLTQQIRQLARTDSLTGLFNRRTMEEELARELGRAARDSRPVTVLLIDIDNLKQVNDTLGHAAGDRLLKACGAAWHGRLRSADLLARYGGDEFAVILPDCSMDHALVVGERLREATPTETTSSIGVAQWDGKESSDQMLRRADDAMYQAKRSGRNRVTAAP